MKCLSEQSQYDSSQDECNMRPASKRQNNSCAANRKPKFQQTEEITLKPRFTQNHDKQKQAKQIPNASKLIQNASKVTVASRKNLMNAYTFKRQNSQKLKKHDPVSLYAQMRQSWNNNKFLKSRADAKEGRKLELDKRNKVIRIV